MTYWISFYSLDEGKYRQKQVVFMASWKKASQRKSLLCHPGGVRGENMIGHEALICKARLALKWR